MFRGMQTRQLISVSTSNGNSSVTSLYPCLLYYHSVFPSVSVGKETVVLGRHIKD